MIQKLNSLDLIGNRMVPPLVWDYLKKEDILKDKVNTWHEFEGFERLMAERNFTDNNREILVKHLMNQYQNAGIKLEPEGIHYRHIQLLLNPATFTITTGHQLSLFGGTLFMAYKILTAIKLASELKSLYPRNNFVPVLWLASEDHDFEEIQSTFLFGKDLVWNKDSAEQATGKLDLNGMDALVDELFQLLGDKEIAQSWKEKIKNSYLNSSNLAEATLRFYHQLFEAFGLIILDPNDAALKKCLVPVMLQDLFEELSFKAQKPSDQRLAEVYKLQINARTQNFFYLHPQLGRKMLKRDADFFTLSDCDIKFTEAELREEILQSPENFSPNVNLRPVFQETILPNLAYIGGPAEVAYWLQLKPVFDAHQVPYPKVVLRFMQVLVGKGLGDKAAKLGLSLSDLLLDEKQCAEKLIDQSKPFNFHGKFEAILEGFQELVEQSRSIDPALSKEFLEKKLQLKDLFKAKLGQVKKALEAAEQGNIEKALKLRSKLFPKGILQERIETLMQFEIGSNQMLLNEMMDIIVPFSGELVISEF